MKFGFGIDADFILPHISVTGLIPQSPQLQVQVTLANLG